jgi:phosphoketolase
MPQGADFDNPDRIVTRVVGDGEPVEGAWRAHQMPIADLTNPERLVQLEAWLRSYRPHALFDANGKFCNALADIAPSGHRRRGSNPHAHGGALLQPLSMPHFRTSATTPWAWRWLRPCPAPAVSRPRPLACSAACCATS